MKLNHRDQISIRSVAIERACRSNSKDDRSVVLELTVAPEDMGKVIGKNGRIARAIRTVVKSSSVKLDKKVIVEIL